MNGHEHGSAASNAEVRPPGEPPQTAGAGSLKQAFRGVGFDEAERALTPVQHKRAGAAASVAPAGAVQKRDAVVQMAAVKKQMKDGPYEWTSAYDVAFDEDAKECKLGIDVKLNPQTGVTEDEVKKTQADGAAQFAQVWDKKFKITDKATSKAYTLRVGLTFGEGAHLKAKLHPGSGRADSENWYVTPRSNVTMPHELGHQMGLKDEYVDSAVTDRKDAKGAGVHTDHSIMGNYYNEGVGKAEAKLRHGEVLAGDIGAATGRSLDTSMNTEGAAKKGP